MSKQVDERVVSMQFDNRQFERNVATSMSTLDKLKQSLNLTGASKGLENVNAAARNVNMSGLGSAVETITAKFSALQVMGVTALANITNSAVNTGKRMIKALTIDPIMTGFSEYETKMNAIQTIMSNTASKGTTMDDVTRVIGELNTYADKTIYNFAEMTRNIGTFTAAGVGLEESAAAIQGIANLAAMSGSNSQQASTAMYQLSQAMASGTVKLMDWNSVVNAGMGGELFQNALKDTARAHGVAVDDMIKKNGSFRESLQEGWITTEILTETLSKMTKGGAAEYLSNLTGIEQDQITAVQKLVEENKDGSASYEELAEKLAATGKVSKEQALEILKMADNAEDAATKVKTFTQLWDTLKESAQSGWSQTWEILIGDFEEAKETLTEISEVIGGVLEASAKARNELLQGWKDAGGRADLVESLFNIFKAVGSVVKPIKEAFREIFPPITVKNLTDITTKLKEFTANLTLSSGTADKVKRIFKGVFSILDIGKKIITSVADAFLKLAGSEGIGSLSEVLLESLASLGDFFTELNKGFDISGISKVFSILTDLISDLIGDIESLADIIAVVGQFIVGAVKGIWDGIKPVFDWIRENISAGDIFAGLAGGGIFVAAKKLSGFLDKIIEVIKGFSKNKSGISDLKKKIGDVLDSVGESLNAFSTSVKVSSLVSIAVAIGILSMSLSTISEIDVKGIVKSLVAIGIMMGLLTGVMKSITKTIDSFGSKGLVKAGFSLILVAAAVTILAKAMEKIGKLSLKEIAKGLIGIGGGLVALSTGLKIIGKTKISLKTSVAILALAKACQWLGDAMHKFATLTWDEIGRGLAAMGGALVEFVAAIAVLDKAGGFKSLLGSIGIAIIVSSLDELAEGLKKFGLMTWDEIGRGLSAMGGALGELTITLSIVGKIAGFSSVFAAGAIWMVTRGLDDLAVALKSFGEMTWDEIGRGLSAMGGALGEVAGFTGALGKIAGFSSIFGAGSILITIQGLDDLSTALKKFGLMTWDEIGRGLSAMGGALLEVAGMSGALGKISGFSSILGSGAILLTIQGLDKLAVSFEKFGLMTWDEIGRGLAAMGGALLEIGIISGGLGYLTGIAGLVGAGTITLAVQGLDELAAALQKFGEMSWDEIGRGLTAMGGALGETALGGLLNTFSGLGALSISEMAGSLGTLADSVKKWSGVSVPEKLGGQLGKLAEGVGKFNFVGMGAGALSESASSVGVLADSVKKWSGVTIPEGLAGKFDKLATAVRKFWDAGLGAGALADSAKPLGDMADSVKKWSGVTVPENLSTDLSALASGVKAFSFAFVGGWSISSLVTPLGSLPDSIKKWSDVSVPENIEASLTSIANGVKAFSFAFAGGWSLETVIGPLGDLPGAIQKWNGVSIPENLGQQLSGLANGIIPFAYVGDISNAAGSVGSLADSLQRLSGINISGVSSNIVGLASSISTLVFVDSISSSVSKLGNSIVTGLVTPINEASAKMSNAGSNMIKALITGIKSQQGILSAVITTIALQAINTLNGLIPKFKTIGSALIAGLASGMIAGAGSIAGAAYTAANSGANAARAAYSGFYSAGSYCVSGFVSGISWNTYKATSAGRALGKAALDAAYAALGIASPSKEFYKAAEFCVIGFVNAFSDGIWASEKAGSDIANSALNGLSNTMSRIKSAVDSEIDINPTIRPVLDLSNIQNGANSIGGMFAQQTVALAGINADYASVNPTVGLTDLISQMQSANDTSNREVVNAITNLRGDFGSLVSAISGLHIRMDSGTVVGELIGKIDNSLGQIASYKGRGN